MATSSSASRLAGLEVAVSRVLFVDERDRDRLIAAGLNRGDQVGDALVDLKLVQVHVVEPVALGQCPRQLGSVDGAALDQRLADPASGRLGFGDRRLDALAIGEAELDDHVAKPSLDERPRGGQGDADSRLH